MKLLEYEAKELFRGAGIGLSPTGGVVRSGAGLACALRRAGRGPWVLKAQVLAGGRGKAGGIQLVRTPAEARDKLKAMLGMKIATRQTQGRTITVREVLVDRAAEIAREIYLSVVMDRRLARPVMVASARGGMEIEELARTRPEAILKETLDPKDGLEDFQARRLGFALELPPERIGDFLRSAKALARLFIELDASLVEINPLALTRRGELLALDGKVVTDDNALYRQKRLAALPDRESSELELKAKKAGLSFIGLDGDIGCLVNGAGLAMATMDTVKLAGGEPANFLDVGGGASAEQVRKAFEIILGDRKVRAVLVNIFGGIMKCTTIAEGILAALARRRLKVPLVVRLEGTLVEEGKALLAGPGLALIQADSLWEAAQKAVAAARAGNGARP